MSRRVSQSVARCHKAGLALAGLTALLLGAFHRVGNGWVDDPPPGLQVFVRQVDGTPIRGATVTATRSDGQQETLSAYPRDAGANEWYHLYRGVWNPGAYSVQVVAAGYSAVSIEDIRILEGDFYGGTMIPVDVLVKMTPVPTGSGASAKEVR